ncbi:MAG TPA: hypothetical protein VHZ26_14550 [Caulobacteraceae bacterium]|jgi:hypothetical protein|nr:hypothetical protein [Caulobacteraceae bacterium]
MPAPRVSIAPAPVAVGLVVAAFTAFAPPIFSDGDTWMHIAAGQWMLNAGAAVQADPFSYTFAGRPWQAHEWLAEVLMALVWRAGGWNAVALLFAAAAGATAGLLTRHVGRWLNGLPLIGVVALGLGCVAPSLLARPHMLALLCLELWTAELVIARAEGRLPSWARLLPIMLVWANLHGSFLFGLGLLGVFGLEAIWQRRREGVRALAPWAVLVAAATLASLVSPYGLETLIFPLRLNGMRTLSGIGEWAAMNVAADPAFETALLAGLFVLLWKRVRLPLLSLLLLLLLVDLSLRHVRHVLLFGVVAPLLIAQPLAEALGGAKAEPSRSPWIAAAGGLLAALLVAARLAIPLVPADGAAAPGAALARVPASLRGQPVFNAYPFGGYLIFSGVRPYIDSRAELYGDAFLANYLKLHDDPAALNGELAARRVAWAILEPGSRPAVLLGESPDWRRLYADRYAVVYARRTLGP